MRALGLLTAVTLLLLVWPWNVGAQQLAWERDGLENREVRALVLSADGLAALTGGARDPTPLWLRDSRGWAQPAGPMPGFVLTLAWLPEGGILIGAGRDITDQPGVFLVSGSPPTSRRLFEAEAVGALAVTPGRDGSEIFAAAAPWADRAASSDLLRYDPTSGTWTVILQGNLTCGQTPSFFRQVVAAPSDPDRLYALEWCFASVVRRTQLWRSDDHGQTWQVLPRNAVAYSLVGSLAVDPDDEDVLYLAGLSQGATVIQPGALGPATTAAAGVERSLDGGQTWSLHGESIDGLSAVRALLVDPREPTRVLAGTERHGVFMSDDRGESWQSLPGLEGLRNWGLVIDPFAGRLYAATSDGVWRISLP